MFSDLGCMDPVNKRELIVGEHKITLLPSQERVLKPWHIVIEYMYNSYAETSIQGSNTAPKSNNNRQFSSEKLEMEAARIVAMIPDLTSEEEIIAVMDGKFENSLQASKNKIKVVNRFREEKLQAFHSMVSSQKVSRIKDSLRGSSGKLQMKIFSAASSEHQRILDLCALLEMIENVFS